MTSYVFEPVKVRLENADGTYRDDIYQSITANRGHTHLSFEEIRLSRYALYPPSPSKLNTTNTFLLPNPKFLHKQSTKDSFTSASGLKPTSEVIPFKPRLDPKPRQLSFPSSISTSGIQVTQPPAATPPATSSKTLFPIDWANLTWDWATKPPKHFNSTFQPQTSSLPTVPPDIFILVEGEPNAYFQSIVAWRDYAHLSFEEMRFAFYESQQTKMQTPCTTCAANQQKAQDQAIVNGQIRSPGGPPTVIDDNPWPLQWKCLPWQTMLERAVHGYKGEYIAKVHFVSGFSTAQQGDGLRMTVPEGRSRCLGEQATAGCDTHEQKEEQGKAVGNAARLETCDDRDDNDCEEKLVKCVLVADGNTNGP